MRGFLWFVSLPVMLGGCGNSANTAGQDTGADEAPAATVFDPMTETMDRAAAVEDLSAGRKAAMDEAIEGAD